MKKQSFIEKIRSVEDSQEKGHDPENYEAHFVVGVDMNADGSPNASMMVSHGTPFETLGMIELLLKNLQDTKKDILSKLSTKKQKSSKKSVDHMLSQLPEPVRNQVIALKKRMDDAMKKGDTEELKKLRDELMNFKNPFMGGGAKDDEDDEDNFNINDFKGGMA
jgi:hypothetical protein